LIFDSEDLAKNRKERKREATSEKSNSTAFDVDFDSIIWQKVGGGGGREREVSDKSN
jgi:hypothetical protein